LEVELFGVTVGFEYDQVAVNGMVDLNPDLRGGGNLDVVLGFAPEIGNEFIVIDNDWSDPISGTFYGLPEGATFTESYLGRIFLFQITYFGNTGNDVVLTTIVPAPSAIVLASLGVCIVGWLHRRRAI
jgi:hypothetical protein